ncbi:hypothetical protein HPB50_011845 [Hyalomma asiaticum]|uniref:Uncharacterized protein n=1 Tax=Hyalomma asiaticum TaxID=266040 RepID=A0ACB7TJD9_HYAAI|nr:hypothetical protein HPB50_011845 [Hyalomma asiaticum]
MDVPARNGERSVRLPRQPLAARFRRLSHSKQLSAPTVSSSCSLALASLPVPRNGDVLPPYWTLLFAWPRRKHSMTGHLMEGIARPSSLEFHNGIDAWLPLQLRNRNGYGRPS